jgi:hypothetical protein
LEKGRGLNDYITTHRKEAGCADANWVLLTVLDSCELGDEHMSSIKGGEFPYKMITW